MYDEGGGMAVMTTRATRNIESPELSIGLRAGTYQYPLSSCSAHSTLSYRIEQAVTGTLAHNFSPSIGYNYLPKFI